MALPKPYFDTPFENYWYDAQFVKFLIQFMAIFEGMHVKIGKNSLNSQSDKIYIPIRRGNGDRVANNIIAKGTANSALRVPMFAAEIVQVQKETSRATGGDAVIRETFLQEGEAFPDGIKVAYKKVPVPYTVFFDLSLITSNDDHKFQIMEQIMTLFDPEIQIQVDDDVFKWNKLAYVILDSINFETAYPYNTDQKLNVTTFQFSSVIYLQTPIDFRKNYIGSIKLKLDALATREDIYNAYLTDIEKLEAEDYEEIANIHDLDKIDGLKS